MKISDNRFREVINLFLIFLRLGTTSFGGPIAHLSYFREEFVIRQKWLSEHAYVDLVALCQLLPGPASSQVGIAIGLARAKYLGAIVAWLGFTLPSTIMLILFAYGLTTLGSIGDAGWIHGLKIVAVAVVAQAVWSMGKNLCPDNIRILFALIAAGFTLLFPTALGQISVIVGGGIMGLLMLKREPIYPHADFPIRTGKVVGTISLIIFITLLILLPLFSMLSQNNVMYVIAGFYRAGSLVFGGGHVVLPLLQSVVVPSGIVSNDLFLAGYGAAQAVPGPLFTFAAYLGTLSTLHPNGIIGATICLIAIFLPSFLLIIGVLPFWENLRRYHAMKHAMQGINASVVGILLAALYNPVWTNAIFNTIDFFIALGAFILLQLLKWPSWLVVIIGAITAQLMIGF